MARLILTPLLPPVRAQASLSSRTRGVRSFCVYLGHQVSIHPCTSIRKDADYDLPVPSTPENVSNEEYNIVRRTIKILLDPEEKSALPVTYDRISRACRAVVSEAGKGEGLYDFLKMELEQRVGKLEKALGEEHRKSVEWLVPFTETCEWFEKQVVGHPLPLSYIQYAAHSSRFRVSYNPYLRTSTLSM